MRKSVIRTMFVFAAPWLLSASTITFVTPTGSTTTGGDVSAQAQFTTSDGLLTITLTDLLANPTDVAQLVSDLQFTLSSSVSGATTTTNSSAQQVTVGTGGSISLGPTGSTGWVFNAFSGGFVLCAVCPTGITNSVGPSQTIIGPPGGTTYSNANGSIAGNGPHNPFLNGNATFTISNPAITSSTVVTGATFSFGTAAGVDISGVATAAGSPVPEPATYALSGLGLLLAGLVGRKLRAVN